MGPGIGLQNRPAGLWKGAEEPGRAGQDQGPRPSGSHQPSSWVLQPGLGTSFLFLFHICHPSGWLWPNGWTQWFCSPLPIPLGTTGHIWAVENHFIKRFWTKSKGPEQLPQVESNLGSKEELLGHHLFW